MILSRKRPVFYCRSRHSTSRVRTGPTNGTAKGSYSSDNNSMKKILRNHSTSVLAVLAFIFLGAIIAAYTWGISYLIFDINEANDSATSTAQAPQFNLSAAAQLD